MKRKERRRCIRQGVNIPAYIIAGSGVYSCHIKDLSEDGFFLETEASIQPGAEISMVYQTSEDKKETKTGEIVRASGLGIGGQFEKSE